jgi:hypothetical protein
VCCSPPVGVLAPMRSLGEGAGERALAVEVGAVEVKGRSADHVVAGVCAAAATGVVDGEREGRCRTGQIGADSARPDR